MFDRIKDILFKIKDYDRLEHDYSCILCYITDGLLSKTNYEVKGLYTIIDDILTERDEQTRREAEKDLAMTWEDIAMIDAIILDTNNEFAIDSSMKIIGQNFYEEVLGRFNEQKKK